MRTCMSRRVAGIDGGVPELIGVHFAQALVALDGLTLARLVEQPLHDLLEGSDVFAHFAALDVRAVADETRQCLAELDDAAVLGRLEELLRKRLFRDRPVLCLAYCYTGGMTVHLAQSTR